jgi:hypothetical protein
MNFQVAMYNSDEQNIQDNKFRAIRRRELFAQNTDNITRRTIYNVPCAS